MHAPIPWGHSIHWNTLLRTHKIDRMRPQISLINSFSDANHYTLNATNKAIAMEFSSHFKLTACWMHASSILMTFMISRKRAKDKDYVIFGKDLTTCNKCTTFYEKNAVKWHATRFLRRTTWKSINSFKVLPAHWIRFCQQMREYSVNT